RQPLPILWLDCRGTGLHPNAPVHLSRVLNRFFLPLEAPRTNSLFPGQPGTRRRSLGYVVDRSRQPSQAVKWACIIPPFNEGEVLGRVIEELRCEAPPGLILVIDDASSDRTAAVAAKAGAKVLRHPLNRGQGAALQTGFEAAQSLGADVVVTFDADGQHHPGDVRRLIESLLSGDYDVALGSRFLSRNDIPPTRRIVLRLAVAFTRIVSRLSITDTHNGLRAIRVGVLPRLRLK